MNDSIRLRAGNRAGMPQLADREPAYVRDEEALYVGTPSGNVKIGGKTAAVVTALAGRVSTMGEILADHTGEIAALQEGQTAHGQTLTEQGNTLAAHSQTLTEQGNTLAAHGQTLTELEVAQQTQGETITKLQQEKLTASPMAALSALPDNADLAAVTAAYNSLIAGLKAAGIMN
ncbi:MAG: hypothetical protein E7445_02355 [Ruminococcaceae bacterium]|nr:hypothetical protein [Oscillospiraceae bacterium]